MTAPSIQDLLLPDGNLPFSLQVEILHTIPADASFPIYLCLCQKSGNTPSDASKAVSLRSPVLTLISYNYIRGQSSYLGMVQEPHKTWSDSTTIAELKDASIPIFARLDVNDIMKDIRHDQDLLPTFKTYNIARSYKLEIKGEIKYLDHYLPVETLRDITILPAIGRPPAPSRVQNTQSRIPSQTSEARSSLDEPPPPYEE